MSVCVVNTSLRSVSLLIMQAAMGFKKTKRSTTTYAVPTLLSFNRLAVPRVLSERRAKGAEKKHVGGISY